MNCLNHRLYGLPLYIANVEYLLPIQVPRSESFENVYEMCQWIGLLSFDYVYH